MLNLSWAFLHKVDYGTNKNSPKFMWLILNQKFQIDIPNEFLQLQMILNLHQAATPFCRGTISEEDNSRNFEQSLATITLASSSTKKQLKQNNPFGY